MRDFVHRRRRHKKVREEAQAKQGSDQKCWYMRKLRAQSPLRALGLLGDEHLILTLEKHSNTTLFFVPIFFLFLHQRIII